MVAVSGRAATAVGLGVPSGWAFWIGAIVTIGLAIALGRQVVDGSIFG